MKRQDFISSLIGEVESRFHTLAFANWATNGPGTYLWWEIGVDKPEVYSNEEYKKFCREKHTECKRLFGKDFLLFKLQTVNEEVLTRYLCQGLIMNL